MIKNEIKNIIFSAFKNFKKECGIKSHLKEEIHELCSTQHYKHFSFQVVVSCIITGYLFLLPKVK